MKSPILENGELGKNSPLIQILRMLVTGLMFHSMDMSHHRFYIVQKLVVTNLLFLLQNFIAMHGTALITVDEDVFYQLSLIAFKFFPEDPED